MNIIKEYRQVFGKTQAELVEELKPICPGIDAPLLSKMEKGLCEPSSSVMEWLQEALASRRMESLVAEQIFIPNDLKKLLNDLNYLKVYSEISKADLHSPATRGHLISETGLKDREVRKIVTELRLCGARIISSSGCAGYWMSKCDTDYKAFRNELISRATSLLKEISAMDKWNPDQMEMMLDG